MAIDPNDLLRRIRDGIAGYDGADDDSAIPEAEDAMTAFKDLDEWLTSGKMLPLEWSGAFPPETWPKLTTTETEN